MAMNRTELVAGMYEMLCDRREGDEVVPTKTQLMRALKAFEDVVTDELADGGKVTLVGFGMFETTTRQARSGKGPHGPYTMPERTVVKFRAGQGLKDAVA